MDLTETEKSTKSVSFIADDHVTVVPGAAPAILQDTGSRPKDDVEISTTGESRESSIEFKRRVEQMVASGAVAFSVSVGIQLGLFRTMAELKTAASVQYIAKQAGCNDRFLKEWLFHMVVGEVVEEDASGNRYWLPQDRAKVLLAEGAADLTTFLPSMGSLYKSLLSNFKTGNTSGAIYSLPETDFFKRWEQRKAVACEKMIEVLIKHVPDLQGGLEHGINVLDVGCGRGHFLFAMAQQYPDSLFTGIDINDDLILNARDRAREIMIQDMRQTNVGFAAYDAAILPTEWTGRFDVVMMHEVIYDLPSPADVLEEVKQVLRRGGVLVMVERSVNSEPKLNLGEHAQEISAKIVPVISLNYSLPMAMSQPEGEGEALGMCSGKEKLLGLVEDCYFEDIQSFSFTLDEQKVQLLIVAKNMD